MTGAPASKGNIIPFPLELWTSRRLTAQDRAEAFAWERAMCRAGYAQITFEAAPSERQTDRLLAYHSGELWVVRGTPPPGRQFGLWHRASGIKLGDFPSVWATLEAIPACMTRSEPGLHGDGWTFDLMLSP